MDCKIIFLDIDGVLTTTLWGSNYQQFNPVAVNGLLKLLTADESIRLVISSTWRLFGIEEGPLYEELSKFNLLEKLHTDWRTISHPALRGNEIKEWLHRHKVSSYLILDDDSDMLPEQLPYFVQTSAHDGFLYNHFVAAMQILGIDRKSIRWNTDFVECKLKQ